MRRIYIFILAVSIQFLSPFIHPVQAVVTNADYTAVPPFISASVPPLVMTVMGRDHKLYYEAYNDASDIDGDGLLDVGYKDSIDYYGYFDSHKCYSYDSTGTAKFVPATVITSTTDHHCSPSATYWSGNLLNWMTTSRVDALRKVFYGGYRSTDSSSETVLEGEYRPQDAHSWGKEMSGSETPLLTPFSDPTGGTLPASSVVTPWNNLSKVLFVTYVDGLSVTASDHTSMVSSYSPCDYRSFTYISNLNDASVIPTSNHIDKGNFFLVTEFQVTSGNTGNWQFAVDGDDSVEVEIDGTVVASYYGSHTQCNCQTHSGTINLGVTSSWHRMIVRHREGTGNDGVKVWYKKPGDTVWIVFGATKNINNSNITQISYRAPTVPVTESIRFMDASFINTGEPAYDASGTGTIVCPTNKHHLYCITSLSDNETPVIRLLKDKTNRIWEWASKEQPVCDLSLGTPTDYYIRVKVCDPAAGLETNCKTYPNGSNPNKPTGLYQKYGESTNKVCSKTFKACNVDSDCNATSVEKCIDKGAMFYGLMTGSYTKNLSGGVVRWNLDSITHAVDNRNVGQIKTASDNLIKTMNNLRITGYDYATHSYNQNCGWITAGGLTEGQCRMWGNPMGEMMYEAERYFAGKSGPTPDYATGTNAVGTDDRILNLTNQSDPNNWIAPYQKYPDCSKPFMIVLSDVNTSYDSDQLPGVDSNFGSFTGDLANLDVKTMTDAIGVYEGLTPGSAFIGQSGTTFDSICSSKTITALGSLRGLCPEEPTKKGSYYSAAVAYYGKQLFSANNNGLPNITTYSVALISPVPEIKIDVNGKTVKIMPVGKSPSGCLGVYTACANRCTLTYDAVTGLNISNCPSNGYCPSNQIVDFYIDTLTSTYGKFRVNFEDVEQGADHDMDSIAEYTYQVSGDDVTISMNSSVYASGCIDQAMGFSISGTTEDRVYLPVKDDDVSDTADADTPTVVADMPKIWSHTFTASSTGSTTVTLHDPLWYAAKWGGFEDTNGNGIPDLQDEWDKDHDGVPDTYFLISNPLKMEQQLTQVFADILKRSASGTSVSILATSAEGEGALYQAYFYPEKIMIDGTKRVWLGYNRGLFLDSYGNLREDSDSDHSLVFKDDRIISMYMDPTTHEVMAGLYLDANEDGAADSTTPASTVPLDGIIPIWEGGQALAKRDKSTRTMYTFVDSNNNGAVDTGEFVSFAAANAATLQPYLRAATAADATNIINYIRGNEVTSYRKRCMPISGATAETGCGTSERVWSLGDVVYSTPTVVASPKEKYDEIYGGTASSYLAFRNQYKDRRHVIYVGANDGMLHAFNAGVYTAGDNPGSADTEHGWFVDNPASGSGWSGVSFGDELWSFIPYDNLPHLSWLTSTDYQHVYYVDLKPKPTDVRIFCGDPGSPTSCVTGQPDGAQSTHPGGWGTILIVGMRFGGGAMDVTADFGSGVQTRTFRSAYYVFDVTNPELAPKLLWRFTNSGLGFTNSYPAIAHVNGSTEKWFVVVGSGPDNNAPASTRGYDGSSTQSGKVFVLNLLDGTVARTFTTDANAFMGDATIVDGLLDYTTDVIYIGSAISGTSGKLYRININADSNPANWTLSTVINQGAPLLVGPTVTIDKSQNLWLLFGTGRFLSANDKTNSDQQTIYGIKDACWQLNTTTSPCTTTYTLSDLMNTSTLAVCTLAAGGGIYDTASGSCASATYASYNALLAAGQATHGWYMYLTNTTDPSERVLSKSVILGGVALFSSYTPTSDVCTYGGNSNLYAIYYETGTAYIKPVIGTAGTGTTETVLRKKSLGEGMPTTVGMAIGKKTKAFIQTSTGKIEQVETDTPGGRSGAVSWREVWESGPWTTQIEEIYKHVVK